MRSIGGLVGGSILLAVVLVLLNMRFGAVPPVGYMLDPWDGMYRTAREAAVSSNSRIPIKSLTGDVDVYLDERGVPHVYAENILDAVRVLGYLQAKFRLFQLDFIPRSAAGRLSEVIGPATLEADRFLRSTGMAWAARNNALLMQEGDHPYRHIAEAFCEGVNTYIDNLSDASLPYEFRTLGYRPERFTPLHIELVNQYMNYDLSYYTDEAEFSILREQIGEELYGSLFEARDTTVVPLIPVTGGPRPPFDRVPYMLDDEVDPPLFPPGEEERSEVQRLSVAPGWNPGAGSNNWAVGPERSATGAPILAGDPHLQLLLPAIWYEAHVVTPEMNTYGVLLPGVPLPVIAFNEYVGWSLTNTGSDQIDHYLLELSEDGGRYRFDDRWLDIDFQPDTIRVKGRPAVIDTLRYSHWGPITTVDDLHIATRWTAHSPSRTLVALVGMNQATDLDSFNEAMRKWDVPMQNVLYADVHGNIAIRAAGFAPVRAGQSGAGLLDGTTRSDEWVDRITFEELPYAENPEQGYLLSANQQPVDDEYPYYLGHRWTPPFRAIRIDSLLRVQQTHSVADFKRYQSDIYVIQRDFLLDQLSALDDLTERASELREMIVGWDGVASTEAIEPLVFDEFIQNVRREAWADLPGRLRPGMSRMLALLAEDRDDPVFRFQEGPGRTGMEVLRAAMERTVEILEEKYTWDREAWRWGDHHKIEFRHLTRSHALRALWRGPYEFPGFQDTVSPGGGRPTHHSASWRMVVDFSESPPRGLGIYPGGQSGNPFSRWYDMHIQTYLDFNYYELRNPRNPADLPGEDIRTHFRFHP